MADFTIQNISIEGLMCAVPSKKIDTTEFYSQFGKDVVDIFIATTGVNATYRTSEQQTASDLCFSSAKALLEKKNIPIDSIGALILVTQTPDYRSPATAAVLQKRLGLNKECICFDVNLGCSGFIYGLYIVGSIMNSTNIEHALLLFGDTISKTASPYDRSSAMLFGDAGCTALLSRYNGSILSGNLKTDGIGFKSIIVPFGGFRNRNAGIKRMECGDGVLRNAYEGNMNGTDVFSFAISEVPRQIKNVMSQSDTTPDSYDALILHQANLMILKQIAKKTKFPMEKVPVSMDRYGNVSGTSVPLTLCDRYGDTDEQMLHLLLSGFGVGLSWGTIDCTINASNIFPIMKTDDYYTEGGVDFD